MHTCFYFTPAQKTPEGDLWQEENPVPIFKLGLSKESGVQNKRIMSKHNDHIYILIYPLHSRVRLIRAFDSPWGHLSLVKQTMEIEKFLSVATVACWSIELWDNNVVLSQPYSHLITWSKHFFVPEWTLIGKSLAMAEGKEDEYNEEVKAREHLKACRKKIEQEKPKKSDVASSVASFLHPSNQTDWKRIKYYKGNVSVFISWATAVWNLHHFWQQSSLTLTSLTNEMIVLF